ncbi:hypothetical protein [Acinetobacter sp. MB5]|uniref:hypothetical protein n=1 Tax=Acinetobacter sp. MB5 TaxID=2069438 RepID=UPI000DD0A8DE|nr:hypothetical protein [Acinetobacter sp. MB5]
MNEIQILYLIEKDTGIAMSRPKISLQEWCNADQKLKLDFIEKESQRSGGLIQRNGDYYTPRVMASWREEISAQLSNHRTIQLDSACFEKLKSRYRTVKKNQKDHHLTKKQYMLNSQTIQQIKRIQEQNTWAREEAVIEHVINLYTNGNTAYKTKEQLKTRPIKLKLLEDEIKENLDQINQLNTKNHFLKQQYEENIKLVAKLDLINTQYKELLKTHQIDVSSLTIDEAILHARIQQIKELFESQDEILRFNFPMDLS